MTNATNRRLAPPVPARDDVPGFVATDIADLPDPRVRAPARLAVDVGDASSSGLIDIHALCPDGATLGPARGLTSAVAAASGPPSPSERDRNLVWAMTGAAAAAVLALVGVAVADPAPTVVIRDAARAAPTLVEMEAAGPQDHVVDNADELDLADAATPDDEDEDEPQIVIEAPEDAPKSKSKPKAKAKTSSKPKPKPKTSSKPKPKPKPKTTTATKPTTSDGGLPAVECILDPAKCDASGQPGAPRGDGGAKTTANLPAKLTAATLRTHLAGPKSQAKTCAPRHGLSAGTGVQVKLSIAGATGNVVSAKALGDYASTSAGACVADALAKASFPRFSADQQGVMYTVRM